MILKTISKTEYKKIFTSLILVIAGSLVIGVLNADPVYAEDITVTCDDEDCLMTPTANEALFGADEDFNNDVKPGDNIERTITVVNEGEEVCHLILNDQGNHDGPFITSNTKDFADNLYSTIIDPSNNNIVGSNSGNAAENTATLQEILENQYNLGSINPGQTLDYTWLVSFDKNAGNEFQNAEVIFDFNITFSCGEPPVQQTSLLLQKSNNANTDKFAGEDVLFTLTVTANEDVDNVQVIDLPPEGFSYRGGTWTANSSEGGDLKGAGITTEPTYASPGTWQLGDMEEGEVVTLTYIADISSLQDPGLYKDLAWSIGDDPSTTNDVLANDTTGIFVGTDVNIIEEPESPDADVEVDEEEVVEEIEEEEGEVLGASTQLPDTGINTIFLITAIGFLLAGGIFVGVGRYVSKKSYKVESENVKT